MSYDRQTISMKLSVSSSASFDGWRRASAVNRHRTTTSCLTTNSSCGSRPAVTTSCSSFASGVSGARWSRSISWSSLVRFAVISVWAWASVVDGGVPGAGTPCVFEGHLKTDRNWFGYLANVSVVTTARMTFEFTYAADRCCQTILFYTDEQTSIINARMNCWQKEYLLRPEDDQVLRLTPRFAWSGTRTPNPA
jgi:hypothetical protein